MKKISKAIFITLLLTGLTLVLHAQDANFCTKAKYFYENLTAANYDKLESDYFTSYSGWGTARIYRPNKLTGSSYTCMLSYNTKDEADAKKMFKKVSDALNSCLKVKREIDGEGSNRHDSFDFDNGSISISQSSSTEGFSVSILFKRDAK